MEEMLSLLDWFLCGEADCVEIFIGSMQNTQKGTLSLIESGTLVERNIITRKKEIIMDDTMAYHQVFFFSPSLKTIIPYFRKYRNSLQKFMGNTILIREKFIDDKHSLKSHNNDQKRLVHKENGLMKRFHSFGMIVVCKIHPFILKTFVHSLRNNKLYKSDIEFALRSTFLLNNLKNTRLNFSFFELNRENFKHSKIIGQFNTQFIILAIKESFFIIDQHALHERIMLEKLIRKYKRIVDMEKAKERACKNAIKFNEKLTRSKMYEMVRWIPLLEQPFICCHGRPSIVHLYTENNSFMIKKNNAKKVIKGINLQDMSNIKK